MLKAKKGNRVLRIEDSMADAYKALGYSILTMDNKVLSVPKTEKDLIAQLASENASLKAENEHLTHVVSVLEDRLKEPGAAYNDQADAAPTDGKKTTRSKK